MADAAAGGTGTGDASAAAAAAAAADASKGSSGADAAAAAAQAAAGAKDGAAAKPAGAPEKYGDFKLPEGTKLEAAELTDFQTFAKSQNLTQEQAQSLLDRTLKTRTDTEASVVAKQQAMVKQLSTDWKTQTQADPEIGGDKLTATLATAVKARDAFGSPALIKILDDSGMGNHPEVVRFFAKVGAAMSEDKHVQGGKAATDNTEAARMARMYPSMVGK